MRGISGNFGIKVVGAAKKIFLNNTHYDFQGGHKISRGDIISKGGT